jgi:molybdate transport system substrate-binding protein
VPKLLLGFILALVQCGGRHTADLQIAVSANAALAAEELASAFEGQTGHAVRMSVASSGTLYAQIANGAPFDLFLSADMDYPRKLISLGNAEPESLRVYALGRLVVWSRRDAGIDCAREEKDCLIAGEVRRVAIANPRHAPYGKASIEALREFGFYDRLQPKLVLGESLAQTLQFAESGAADVAIVSLSLALSPSAVKKGTYWLVPEGNHSPIEQGAVLLRTQGKDQRRARLFLDFLSSKEGTAVLVRHGYMMPKRRATGNSE